MSDFRLTPTARADLDGIADYLGPRDPEAGDRILAAIEARFGFLAEFPEAGEARRDMGPGVRCFTVGRYVLYYRPRDGYVEILRVLHGSRDARPWMFDL